MTFENDARALRDPAEIVAYWDAAGHLDPAQLGHHASPGWWDLIDSLGITLLVTREYEHLVVAISGGRQISHLRLPHPSGLAVDRVGGSVYVAATRNPNQVMVLMPAKPGGCLVPVRSNFYPGSLYLHDLAIIDRSLYGNAVGQNAVVKFLPGGTYRRVWWPASLDRMGASRFRTNYLQLNSIAANGELAKSFFSASAATAGRRRPGDLDFGVDGRGVIFSAATREPIVVGLTRPHSTRMHRGRIWVDDSGYGRVGFVDGSEFRSVAELPGWTRGLCFVKDIAFVGTSRVIPGFRRYAPGVRKETCGIHALDTRSGEVVASLTWPHGNQIFAIDWCPRRFTSGLPFRRGATATRLKEAREFFYDYRIRRSTSWLV